jgi:uncharacterized protein YndB with AHSA1/START domain
VPIVEAERELLARPADVWAFVAEPRHLADWWPGMAAVEPDRRGFAPGARWEVRGGARPGLLRRAHTSQLLLVREIEPRERFVFHLTGDRLDVELALARVADGTLARLTVRSPWLVGVRRSLPRTALARLHDLCQTAASLDDAAD